MENNRPNKVPITRLTKFFDEIDFDLEIGFGREYMDVYKEVKSQDIRFFAPIELQVNLEIVPGENQTYDAGGTLRYRDYGNMTFNVYQKQLSEKGCEIKYGDYIGYRDTEDNMKFWTVVNDGKIFSDNEHTVFGYKGATRTVECTTVDPNEFEGI